VSRLSLRLLLAQSADAATYVAFYLFVGTASGHAERNPVVLALMALGGVQAVGLAKVAVAWFLGWRADRRGPVSVRYDRLRTIAMSVATASGIAGAGYNLASIIDGLGRHA
jgi:NhaP-type Na+/H+ or K+/H+ antiporter